MGKKSMRFISLGLAGLMLIIFNSNLSAGPEAAPNDKSSGIGFDAGYVLFSESQFNGSAAFGFNLFYSITDNFRIELAGTYISCSVGNNPEGLSKGKLRVIPLQLSLQYRFNINKQLVPYLGAGAGYYLNNFTIEGESEWQELGFEIGDTVDNTFGFHAGGGVEYFFKPGTAFFLDVRYCIAPLSGMYSITDVATGISNSGDFDGTLDFLQLAAGIKLLF